MHQIKTSDGKFDGVQSIEEYIIRIGKEHKTEKRALAFAFIVYDFDNPHIDEMLAKSSYYNALDYISGKTLTVFYINSSYLNYQSEKAKESNKMNFEFGVQKIDAPANVSPKYIAEKLINKDSLPSPSIMFFRISDNTVSEYTIAHLRENEIEKGFNELLKIIKTAVDSLSQVKEEYRDNEKEIFSLLKQSIESSEFWKTAKAGYNKMMKLKDFLLFWKV